MDLSLASLQEDLEMKDQKIRKLLDDVAETSGQHQSCDDLVTTCGPQGPQSAPFFGGPVWMKHEQSTDMAIKMHQQSGMG